MRIRADLRYELKYLINRDQYARVLETIQSKLLPDPHGGISGAYQVTSLYYDTSAYQAFWDKVEGHKVRRKVRIRVYGDETVEPETAAFLEIKQRFDKLTGKQRVRLPYARALDFDAFETRDSQLSDADWQVMSEVFYLHRTLVLRPSAVVTYDRLAFEGGETYPDLRVTFDTRLRGRIQDLSLLSGGQPADQYFLPPDVCILEVKVDHTVPYWLTTLLSKHRCILRRVSKYCAALEQGAVINSRTRIIAVDAKRQHENSM